MRVKVSHAGFPSTVYSRKRADPTLASQEASLVPDDPVRAVPDKCRIRQAKASFPTFREWGWGILGELGAPGRQVRP